MKFLAIDTSGSHLTVIANGEKLSVKYIEDCRLSHSVVLMDEIEKALSEAEMTLKDAEVLACCVGPGSFTGIRIGISTIKAFAYAENKKVLPVTSFEVLAYNKSSEKDKLTLIDARHDNFYACGFSKQNEVILDPFFAPISEIEKICGNYDIISDIKIDNGLFVENKSEGFLRAVQAKLNSATDDRESLIPLYVKKSQAEEEL